jgi:ABC-type uncharacterized transport system substrate-binding protein
LPRLATAQTQRVRIGALGPRRNSVLLPPALRRLAELGFVEGKNLVVDYRSADGAVERFPALARELVSAKCDLIFAIGTVHAAQALMATKTRIPVVILANDYDPVKAGIVTNLRRPGANITGVVISEADVLLKRLEIMHEILPKAQRILVLFDSFTSDQLETIQDAARARKLVIIAEDVGPHSDALAGAFAAGAKAEADAVMILTSPRLFDRREAALSLAIKHRLPAVTSAAQWGESGVLFAFGANFEKAFVRAGDIAGKILRGTSPGDIPVERATEFELVVNVRTARALGIAIPSPILVRADRILQ